MKSGIIILTICLLFSTFATVIADTDDLSNRKDDLGKAEFKRHQSELTEIEEKINGIKERLAKLEELTVGQFEVMITDVVSGSYNEGKYISKLLKPVQDTLDYYKKKGLLSARKNAQRIKKRWSGLSSAKYDEIVRRSQRAEDSCIEIELKVKRYSGYWDQKEEKLLLNEDIFQSYADEIVSKILEKPKYLDDFISLEENRLEFFLAGPAEKMWPKIKQGKKPFCVSTYKITLRDALIMINEGKTYDVEKDLRKADKKYSKKDPIKLLYAYVLLINWHDRNSMEKGYKYLKQAYDNLETEKLAYNLVRVGLRLEKLDEGKLYKIIDHVKYRDDKETLGELSNILLYTYLKRGAYVEADSFLKGLRENQHKLSRQISSVYKFIVFLKQGKYGLIATDVVPYDNNNEVETLYNSL
jgi:hypothetical protein